MKYYYETIDKWAFNIAKSFFFPNEPIKFIYKFHPKGWTDYPLKRENVTEELSKNNLNNIMVGSHSTELYSGFIGFRNEQDLILFKLIYDQG